MANYHFMDCCFDYKKSRINEECNLMGCKGKHYFQEYFREDHIKKSSTVIALRESSSRNIDNVCR